MDKNQKLSKKDKKKLKAKEKQEQNSSKLNKDLLKEQKLAQIEIKYGKIPLIPTIALDEHSLQSISVVKTKNKKLEILVKEVMKVLEDRRSVDIIGEDMEIPKTVSLCEIVKRELETKNTEYEQTNVLGRNEGKKPCLKLTLKIKT